MTLNDVTRPVRPQMEEAVKHFEAEMSKIRTGRAQTSLVEDLPVSYYGAQTPIKQMASLTVPESNQILITPWDKQAVGDIEQAIRQANLGLNPSNDGHSIRLVLPSLTEERRKELTKQLGALAETARVRLRTMRKEAWEEVQEKQKAGELTEDDRYRGEEELNKLIDEFNKKVEELSGAKEKELLSV